MNIVKIGALIKYERVKQNISIEKLAKGICSESVIRRTEAGERGADFFVLDMIVSRLGRSDNKVELIQDEKDYELYELREKLTGEIENKNYDEAAKLLTEYEVLADIESPLHLQYIEMIKGFISEEKYRDFIEADRSYYQALTLTLPEFSLEKLENYLLGENELILLTLYLNNKEKLGENLLKTYGITILNYIERHFYDEEIKCNLYGRVSLIVGNSYMKNNRPDEALQIILKAEQMLTGNGLLLNISKLLENILFISKNINTTLYQDYKKMRDALKDLYEEYGFEWNTNDINLLTGYKQRNVNIISEIVKQERVIRGISQQKLADDLDIDVKTISRIECGKAKPKRGTIQKILNYFNIEAETVESRIITDDFRLLDMEREIAKLTTFQKYGEAEHLFNELKQRIPLDNKKNRQYVEYMSALFDLRIRQCDVNEVADRLIKAFSIIRGEMGLDNVGRFVPSRAEAIIINGIAVCYEAIGETDKSIELLEKTVMAYERSKVNMKYRYIPLALLYVTLCSAYEETNRFEKAVQYADKTINYSISSLRGDFLGFLLEEKTYTLDRITGDNTKSKSKYIQSYRIRCLMKASERQKAPLRRAFQKWYGEELR